MTVHFHNPAANAQAKQRPHHPGRMATFLVAALVLLAATESKAKSSILPETRVVSIEGQPLEISEYAARYKEGSNYVREGVHHSMRLTNRTDKTVVAYVVGLHSFNVFNEHLGTLGGWAIEDIGPGKTGKSSWIHSPYADFSFLIGVAYVKRVRFLDGTIWDADSDEVLEVMQEIQAEFTVEDLEEEKD